jgi:hypothetical protein
MHLVGGTERNPRDRRRTRETRAEGYNEHEISQILIARASARAQLPWHLTWPNPGLTARLPPKSPRTAFAGRCVATSIREVRE